jgi:hypothetical protein
MSHRIVNPAVPPRRIQPAQPVDIVARRAALARAEKVAAVALAQADDAFWVSMHPIQRAEVMRDRAFQADKAAAHLRREVESYQPAPPPRQALPSPEAVREALVQQALTDARNRVIELRRLGELSEKHGVTFDVEAAIASDISLPAARAQIMDAWADASEAITLHNRTSAYTAEVVNHAAGWNSALVNVAARQGLKL